MKILHLSILKAHLVVDVLLSPFRRDMSAQVFGEFHGEEKKVEEKEENVVSAVTRRLRVNAAHELTYARVRLPRINLKASDTPDDACFAGTCRLCHVITYARSLYKPGDIAKSFS